MTTPFKRALTLLRDLADMQNGEKKDNCTCCPECGCKEYVNKNLVGDGYRMCRECHQDWWIDINYSSKFCKPLIDRVYDFLNEHEEPLDMTIRPPQGMHPKTWAFLNKGKSSELTQLEEGFEDKLQTVQPKKGGGFWVTVEGKGI